jgi:hypothetical protein
MCTQIDPLATAHYKARPEPITAWKFVQTNGEQRPRAPFYYHYDYNVGRNTPREDSPEVTYDPYMQSDAVHSGALHVFLTLSAAQIMIGDLGEDGCIVEVQVEPSDIIAVNASRGEAAVKALTITPEAWAAAGFPPQVAA